MSHSITPDLDRAKDELEDRLFKVTGVHGVALELDDDGEPALVIDVTPGISLSAGDIKFPARIRINQRPMRAIFPPPPPQPGLLIHDQRLDPLQAGIEIARQRPVLVEYGTLGMIGFRSDTGAPAILSCWHVLCGPGTAAGDVLLQPFRGDAIAQVYLGAMPSTGVDVDAAAAELNGSRGTSQIPYRLGPTPITQTAPAYVTQHVVKSGRTTEVTSGRVVSTNISVRINYPGWGAEIFRRQIGIAPHPDFPPPDEISKPGDSGAVWLDFNTRAAVGLHFSGELGAGADASIANPIDAAMSAVRFSLDGAVLPPSIPVARLLYNDNDSISQNFDHLFTANTAERPPRYVYEGVAFRWFTSPGEGMIPIYRWWSRVRFNHYYHLGPGEEFRPGTDYQPEGRVGFVSAGQGPGMVQLWCGYHERMLDHLYTINRNELVAGGYSYISPWGFVLPP